MRRSTPADGDIRPILCFATPFGAAWTAVRGFADVDEGSLTTAGSALAVGPASKQFTATAVLPNAFWSRASQRG
jgi:hypothetical protein